MNIFNKFFIAGLILINPFFIYASDNLYDVPLGDSPSLGSEKAPVTIIEFIDYQ